MRTVLLGISVLGLLGAGVAVGGFVLSHHEEVYITREGSKSFNFQNGPEPARAPMASGETLRDAVSAAPPVASSLTRPIADSTFAVAKPPVKEEVPEKRYTVITPKAESWAKRHKFFSDIAARPAAALLARGPLGSARALRAFLSDRKKVDSYMNSAIVRVTLNSPTAAKALLGNPVVVRAALATPAMRDGQAVRALLGSPMLKKMLDCPAVQEALADPGVIQRMITDPQTILWLAHHPDVMTAIGTAAPALAEAAGSQRPPSASVRLRGLN